MDTHVDAYVDPFERVTDQHGDTVVDTTVDWYVDAYVDTIYYTDIHDVAFPITVGNIRLFGHIYSDVDFNF